MFDLTVSEHSYFIDWAKIELSRDSAVIGDLNRKYLREFGTVYGNTSWRISSLQGNEKTSGRKFRETVQLKENDKVWKNDGKF